MSPPIIEISNSLHAFLKPETISLTFEREIIFGRLIEIIPYLGLTPFAAKSLTHATTLFLAASDNFILDGISVLSTNVSVFAIILILSKFKISTSSDSKSFLPKPV